MKFLSFTVYAVYPDLRLGAVYLIVSANATTPSSVFYIYYHESLYETPEMQAYVYNTGACIHTFISSWGIMQANS